MADALLQMFVLVIMGGRERDVPSALLYQDVNMAIVKPKHLNAFVMMITCGVEHYAISVSIV